MVCCGICEPHCELSQRSQQRSPARAMLSMFTREPCVGGGQEGSKPLTMSRLAKLDKRLAHVCGTQRSRNETKGACMEEALCLKQSGMTDEVGLG